MVRSRSPWILLFLACLGAAPSTPPSHLIWESKEVLTTATRRAMEGLLLQHQHLTGERLFLVLAPSPTEEGTLPEGDASESAKKLFDSWSLEITARGANALLLIRERKPGRLDVGAHLGSGMTLEEPLPLESIEDSIQDLPSWDHLGIAVTQAWLTAHRSPVLAQSKQTLPAPSLPVTAPSFPQQEHAQGESKGWLGIALTCLVALGIFYGIYQLIIEQEVLIGTQRWILFGPRLKLRLWLGSPPQALVRSNPKDSEKPKLFWSSQNG